MRHITRSIFISVAVVLGSIAGIARATGPGVITGVVYADVDRDGRRDPGEEPFAGQTIYAFTSAGAYAGGSVTGADGSFGITGLADGTYTVEFDQASWWSLRERWVPTTTGSVYLRRAVDLAGTAQADFGLREIVRSATLGAPLSAYTGPGGLRAESYTDAVTAREVHDALAAGNLPGAAAPLTFVRFGYTDSSSTATSMAGAPGTYTAYSATVWLDYLGWLDTGDEVAFHEYGHAWSLYNEYIVQQDGAFRAYLAARGLTGDPRLGSSKAWDPREMVAEDYRQLFATPVAAAWPQANPDVPRASQVPGLPAFLRDTYGAAPAPEPTPEPSPSPSPEQLTVTGLGVTPAPVVSSGLVSFTISTQATVTVRILSSKGALVRTLLANATRAAGDVGVSWDRKNASGRRVKAGTYVASVTAVAGTTVSASRSFTVA